MSRFLRRIEQKFGEILPDLRLSSRAGLRELARGIHKSPDYFSDVENGRASPSCETVIVQIASLLCVDGDGRRAQVKKVDIPDRLKAADLLREARDKHHNEGDFEGSPRWPKWLGVEKTKTTHEGSMASEARDRSAGPKGPLIP